MKKIIFSLAAIAALAGCSKEIAAPADFPAAKKAVTLELSLIQAKATIVDNDEGTATFAWDKGDKIGVLVGGEICEFTLEELPTDGGPVKLKGDIPEGSSIEEGASVVYPYCEDDAVENDEIVPADLDNYTIEKPNDFRARWKGVLEPDDVNGGFKTALLHTAAIFRVTYSAVPDAAKAVTLTQGGKTVTLNLGESFDKTVEEGKSGVSFYFPVAGGEKNGFTVALTDGNNVIAGTERNSTKALNFEVGCIYRTPVIKLLAYQKVADKTSLSDGKYILVYPDGTTYRLFSFQKSMENAEAAAATVADVHGLSELLSHGSALYSGVIGNNCVDVESVEDAEILILTPAQEKDAALDVTMLTGDNGWKKNSDGKITLAATVGEHSYSIPVDHTIINSIDGAADIIAVFNAPGIVNTLKTLRGTDIPVTFDYLITFAVEQAKKEGVTFTDAQIARLRSGFEHLCALAKDIARDKLGAELMDINLSTNPLDVFSRYYDNAAEMSYSMVPDKRFGLATIGYHAYDKGFTFNIGLPNYGWFNRVDASLKGDKDACIEYWAQFDAQYDSQIGIENFFRRAATRALNELDSSTYEMLHQMALENKFTAIGKVYNRYATRFNDKLEPVYIYKKVE